MFPAVVVRRNIQIHIRCWQQEAMTAHWTTILSQPNWLHSFRDLCCFPAVFCRPRKQVTGVFGYNDDYDTTVFGNIDVLPLPSVALGLEYKQGASFDSFKNADYWDAHVAWFGNKNLTLVLAYVNAGDEKSTSKVGLGDGVVLSTQYAF